SDQIKDEFAILSAGGSDTVLPTLRAVPLNESLQVIVALLLASMFTLDTVTTSPFVVYGVITCDDALRMSVIPELLTLVVCETRSATVRAVSVTLRSALMACDISTVPR